jgi:hypothetical protein
MGQVQKGTEPRLAERDPQEKCLALVRIGTRKHRSASPRAFRQENQTIRTGRAAQARVASCEIKGFTEQEATLACAVGPAPDRWAQDNHPDPP